MSDTTRHEDDIEPLNTVILTETQQSFSIMDHSLASHDATQERETPQDSESSRPGQNKMCGVCNESASKYKCSRCEIPYCSVACATLHRATHPAVTEAIPLAATEEVSASNGHAPKRIAGTVFVAGSRNPFTVLETSWELQTLFMVYPRLRSQLRDIYNATLPPANEPNDSPSSFEDISFHSQRGRAVAGRGRGGRNVRGGYSGPWNADRSTQDGIDALSNAKLEYGKGGEGIREYADLVLKLVSVDGIDVAQLVQDEVAEENAKIIAQLLNGDPY